MKQTSYFLKPEAILALILCFNITKASNLKTLNLKITNNSNNRIDCQAKMLTKRFWLKNKSDIKSLATVQPNGSIHIPYAYDTRTNTSGDKVSLDGVGCAGVDFFIGEIKIQPTENQTLHFIYDEPKENVRRIRLEISG